MSAFTRWRLGMNLRLVIAVMCVPMPPCFLGLPLRQMMLPLRGPTPVSSQILAIIILFQIKAAEDNQRTLRGKHYFRSVLDSSSKPANDSPLRHHAKAKQRQMEGRGE